MNARKLFLVLLAGCLMLSGCGFTGLYSATWLPGGASTGDHPYTVNIQFSDVLDLVPQSAVKVNDVPVGKVNTVKLTATKVNGQRKWVAAVTVVVRGTVHLPGNARADIAQTSLLGEKYVSLSPQPGVAPKGKLGNHSSIPLSRTSSAYEAEQVLGALSLLLNDGGLTQLQTIAHELNNALGTTQRQQATRDLLHQLTTFTGTLNAGRNDITTALENIDKLAASLNKNQKVITDALDTYPQALSVLSKDEPKLVTLLTSLSKFGVVATHVVNASQTQLTAALKALNPVLLKLTGAGNDLPGALRIAGTFPFPLGNTRQFVRGDYANMNTIVDLNLNTELCGLINVCIGSTKVPTVGGLQAGRSAGSTPVKPSTTSTTKKSTSAESVMPLVPGAGK
ncbi:MCE family protein [uncultured Jatrophihabitans sp.]|uniref:MCE family protein n=1 Tax=uncultured Jatrophihabitans sp. TaxID=1610747 RepID=UPI0035CA7E1A